MEEDVVREASAVVFVTDETADLVMTKYPDEWRRKVSVVPHGFDARLCGAASRSADRRLPMRMVYTGRFYAGVRTPLPLLRALAELNEREPLSGSLEVLFLGPHVEEFEREAAALGVASFVRFRGRVPAVEAASAAAEADVLLVIDAPSDGPSAFLPSKLFDYLPFRRPILGVTTEPGASARLLRRLGCPVAPPETSAPLCPRWRVSCVDGAGTLHVGEAFDRVSAEFDMSRTARLLHDVLIRPSTSLPNAEVPRTDPVVRNARARAGVATAPRVLVTGAYPEISAARSPMPRRCRGACRPCAFLGDDDGGRSIAARHRYGRRCDRASSGRRRQEPPLEGGCGRPARRKRPASDPVLRCRPSPRLLAE
jgi:hypothetical protein